MSNCHRVAGAPLIDLAASRLALCAPALRAAATLTRLNRSAQRLPCGQHAVPTAAAVDPWRLVAEHCVERGDHLTHHRHDDDLRLLSGGREAIVESFERRIATHGDQSRHVEHASDGRATAPDTARSFELAAVEGVGCKANQSCDLFAVHAAELGQERNQRASQDRADPRHRGEQPVAVNERGIGRDDLDQVPIEQVDIGGEPSDAAARKTLSIASSSSLEAFSAATFASLSWRRTVRISASRSTAGA